MCDDGCSQGESYMPKERPRRNVVDRVRRGLGLGQRQSQELERMPANFVSKYLTSKQAPPDIADLPQNYHDFWPDELGTSSPLSGCKTHGICPGEQKKIDAEANRTPSFYETSAGYNSYMKKKIARYRDMDSNVPSGTGTSGSSTSGTGTSASSKSGTKKSGTKSASNKSATSRSSAAPRQPSVPRTDQELYDSYFNRPPAAAANKSKDEKGRVFGQVWGSYFKSPSSSSTQSRSLEEVERSAIQLAKFQKARRKILSDVATLPSPSKFRQNQSSSRSGSNVAGT